MPRCLIGLGANLGDRARTLQRAAARLRHTPGVQLEALSRWHETEPAGGPPGQPPYLNGAATVVTSLAPAALWGVLAGIEHELGRKRARRWAARPVDLDLLLYDDLVCETAELTLPHPRMAFRRFVLEPAGEIAGDMLHPAIGWTVERLLRHLIEAVPYVAIGGPPGAGKTRLAEELVRQAGGRLIRDPAGTPRLAGLAANRAGQAGGAPIEFFAGRKELVARDRWLDTASLAVSDFWFDQSWADASVWRDAPGETALGDAWLAARGDVVPPKLLVVLDAPEEELLRNIAQRGAAAGPAWDGRRLRRLREAIARQARLAGQGPVLWLSAADRQGALAELVAAVAAMR